MSDPDNDWIADSFAEEYEKAHAPKQFNVLMDEEQIDYFVFLLQRRIDILQRTIGRYKTFKEDMSVQIHEKEEEISTCKKEIKYLKGLLGLNLGEEEE